jgi:LAO/AO transport system kinase
MKNKKRPNWVPENAGKEFTTSVMSGLETQVSNVAGDKYIPRVLKRKQLTVDEYVQGVLDRDLTIIARAITLIESNSIKHLQMAQELLKKLLPYTGNSIRVGITGVPGAGKSTFIEALGCKLIKENHKVAVLAIDPSSSVTKGSILGDKTRMEKLSRSKECFIRPSPSSGNLGGVTRKTRETILICEAAGYDVILVETVGVGQNEITVRSMVDFFLLMKIAGAGDELQGIKKGVIELADAILINKADGDNLNRANVAKEEFARALHYLKSPTPGWTPEVHTASAILGEGVDNIWDRILEFMKIIKESDTFENRRKSQMLEWLHAMIKERLEALFYHNPKILAALPSIEREVLEGTLPPTKAAMRLLETFETNYSREI